jgi:predicted phosphoribosyltransferase
MKAIDISIPLVREGVLLASIVSLLLLAAIIALVVRTLSLPVCRKCGFNSVRHARSHNRFSETLARVCFVVPYRCEKCLRRFYCFGTRRARPHSDRRTMAAGRIA